MVPAGRTRVENKEGNLGVMFTEKQANVSLPGAAMGEFTSVLWGWSAETGSCYFLENLKVRG